MIQRHVYEVIVVKSDNGDVLEDKKLVASSSEAALAKIDLTKVCETNECTVDDTEFVILKLGSLRAVQEVANKKVNSF